MNWLKIIFGYVVVRLSVIWQEPYEDEMLWGLRIVLNTYAEMYVYKPKLVVHPPVVVRDWEPLPIPPPPKAFPIPQSRVIYKPYHISGPCTLKLPNGTEIPYGTMSIGGCNTVWEFEYNKQTCELIYHDGKRVPIEQYYAKRLGTSSGGPR